jgi:hypothetical protein
MNQLEASRSGSMAHLDPNKLSYPGDTFSLNDKAVPSAFSGSNSSPSSSPPLTSDQLAGGSSFTNQWNNMQYNFNDKQSNQNNYRTNSNNNYGNDQFTSRNDDNSNNNYYQGSNNNNYNQGSKQQPSYNENNGRLSSSSSSPQKIEFTIETINTSDGRNIVNIEPKTQQQQDFSNLSDHYNPYAIGGEPYGPNGGPSSDGSTPPDMLPPPQGTPTNFFNDYKNNN